MSILGQDLRYAVRSLARRPGFAAITVFILGLGIGANTAIFSVVDGVLLRPTPLETMDDLVMIWETDRMSGTAREPASIPDFLDFQRRSTRAKRLAAFAGGEMSLTPEQGDPTRLAALAVSHEFLPTLGVEPLAGRTFTPEEDRAGGPKVVLIGENLWTEQFTRDPAAIGATLRLDDTPHTIVGILPNTAAFGTLQVLGAADYGRSFVDRGGRPRIDIWVPLQPDPVATPRSTHPIFVLGQLAPAATLASLQQEFGAIAAELEESYPENEARGVHVEAFSEVVFGHVRPTLLVLLGAVALVLLVACTNVANLLLARGTSRVREVAIRTALGAAPRRLARQFLAESIVLTLAAVVLGVALAFGGLEALLALAPAGVPRLDAVSIDGRVLAWTVLVSVVVGTVFGLVPMLQARRVDLQSSLKGEGARSSSGVRDGRLRSALVVSELALAVMLMVGAGLLIRSFTALQRVDPGFDAGGVLKAEYQLPESRYPRDFDRYPNWQEVQRFNEALLQRASALPGVESAAIAGNHPLDAGFASSFVIVGREAESEDLPEISVRRAGPSYLGTLRTPLVAGRQLQASDGAAAAPVLLINEAARARFFADQDPLGQRIELWGAARTIVGVVRNERSHGVVKVAPFAVYLPLAQAPSADGSYSLLLRVRGAPGALSRAVGAAVRDIDPGLPVFGVEPLAETLENSVGQQRFAMLLLGLFAAVALVLALAGVHGVLSYAVAQRTREIGIRMALGSTAAQVRRLVVIQGAKLALAGLALGLLGALALSQVLASLLYGISAHDPATFAAVVVPLTAAALIASYAPARRATRVDPMVALKTE